jgi:hypothetical protein
MPSISKKIGTLGSTKNREENKKEKSKEKRFSSVFVLTETSVFS